MDLEKILAEKAAARAAAEAAETEAAAAEEAERIEQEEREKQQEQSESIERQLGEVDVQITETEELLSQLDGTSASVRQTLGSRRTLSEAHAESSENIDTLLQNETFRPILEEEGITSKEDLLGNEMYQEAEQVKKYQETEESLGQNKAAVRATIETRSGAKDAAREALQEEHPEISRTYAELHDGLQVRLESLRTKRRELYLQTPEGQAERAAAVGEVVDKSIPASRMREFWSKTQYNSQVFNADNLAATFYQHTPSLSEMSAQYGPQETITEAHDCVLKKIDAELGRQYLDEPVVRKLEETAPIIEKKVQDWGEFVSLSEIVEQRDGEIKQAFARFLDDENNHGIKTKIENYLGGVDVPSEELAEIFVDNFSALNWDARGHNGERFGDSNNAITTVEYFEKTKKEFPNKAVFESALYQGLKRSTASVPDASLLLEAAKKQGLVFDEFQRLIDAPPDEVEEFDSQQFYRDVTQRARIGPDLRLGQTVLPWSEGLPDTLDEFKDVIEKKRTGLEDKKSTCHEQFSAAYADQCAMGEFYAFESKNQPAIEALKKQEQQRIVAAEIMPQLSVSNLGLSEGDQIEFSSKQNGLVFAAYDAKNNALKESAQDIRGRLDEIKDSVQRIQNRARQEGDGLFNGKKKQRESELRPLEEERASKEAELEVINQENIDLQNEDRTLTKLRVVLRALEQSGIDVEVSAARTVGELLSTMVETLNRVQAENTNNELRETYESLQKNAKAAAARREERRRTI